MTNQNPEIQTWRGKILTGGLFLRKDKKEIFSVVTSVGNNGNTWDSLPLPTILYEKVQISTSHLILTGSAGTHSIEEGVSN